MIPSCEAILNDPAASSWLKLALVSALERDPVDAANDAEVLAAVLRKHCDAALFAGQSVGNLLDALQDELRRNDGDDRG
jgi:enoyl-CoA hydratase/carnithine racemase